MELRGMNTVYEVVAMLRREGRSLSRNRNYDLFEHPLARRALKVHHHLRRLEQDLLRHARSCRLRLRPAHADPLRSVIEMEVPALRLKRRIYLEAEELAFLRENPKIAQIL